MKKTYGVAMTAAGGTLCIVTVCSSHPWQAGFALGLLLLIAGLFVAAEEDPA